MTNLLKPVLVALSATAALVALAVPASAAGTSDGSCTRDCTTAPASTRW